MSERHVLSYLEVLDDEHLDLAGASPSPEAAALREAYAAAMRDPAADPARLETREAAFRTDLIARLHRAGRSALCFSGGGIRSATFGLGLLQGLARASAAGAARPLLLGEIDFISTVSGGGYLGAWFSAWATRVAKHTLGGVHDWRQADRSDGPAEVISRLGAPRNAGFNPDVAPVHYLRAYSNYLTPKLGVMSGDTWALAGSVVRNLFLNWLVLLPLLAAFLLIPLGSSQMLRLRIQDELVQWAMVVTALAAGALATGYVGYDLPSAGNAKNRYVWYAWFCLAPLTIAAVHMNVFWAWLAPGSPDRAWWDVVGRGRSYITWWQFGIFGAVMHAGGMLLGIVLAIVRFKRPAPVTGLYATAAAGVTGFVGGVAGFALTRFGPGPGERVAIVTYTIVAFPLVMLVFLFAGALLVGLTSYITEDKDREWWARSGGLALAVAIAWPIFASTVLLAGAFLHWLAGYAVAKLAAATGATGWAVARLGGSAQTPPAPREGDDSSTTGVLSKPWLTELAARLVLPVFVVLLAMLLAVVNRSLVGRAGAAISGASFEAMQNPAMRAAIVPVLLVAALYIIVSVVSSFFINVNSFSLHAMYRQRLIRAYLGASNPRRQPHLFTGFDEHDNIPMCGLTTHKPLHVVNIALNLVAGTNLAWQQRKAESFTSTRLHTGSCRLGYRSSQEYGGHYRQQKSKSPITLGTAMTISGAAASPNMGYNSSPLLTLVMTLFNARLGWWLGNPRASGDLWKLPGPRFGIRPFVDEALGLTNDQNSWIYLSDGGHFENLGLYEMVLRRCRLIVVADGGADPRFVYEDLGNAVRKIRIDLGISISFDQPMPMSRDWRSPGVRAPHHCAIGTIDYGTIDPGAEPGTIVYVKASLSGDEPLDVLQYAAQNRGFPHQPTPDQFFDESQFESYRRLGLHIAERICGTRLAADDANLPVPGQMNLASFEARAVAYSAGPQG